MALLLWVARSGEEKQERVRRKRRVAHRSCWLKMETHATITICTATTERRKRKEGLTSRLTTKHCCYRRGNGLHVGSSLLWPPAYIERGEEKLPTRGFSSATGKTSEIAGVYGCRRKTVEGMLCRRCFWTREGRETARVCFGWDESRRRGVRRV